MFSSITNYFSPSSSIAEPSTTSVQFPSANSQQRAKLANSNPIPSFEVEEPQEEQEEEEETPEIPTFSITPAAPTASSLAPPTTTTKVLKAPKGRVRVEKGFSQLDWARINRSGEVDLRGGVTELRRISVSEMAQHKTKEDCWQAYNGKVYNVGPFLKFHPGGGGEMMRGAGKDATQLFSTTLLLSSLRPEDADQTLTTVLAHAWVNYETLLENCLVGFLVRD